VPRGESIYSHKDEDGEISTLYIRTYRTKPPYLIHHDVYCSVYDRSNDETKNVKLTLLSAKLSLLTLDGQSALCLNRSEFVADFARVRCLVTRLDTNHSETRLVAIVRHLVAFVRLQLLSVFRPTNRKRIFIFIFIN